MFGTSSILKRTFGSPWFFFVLSGNFWYLLALLFLFGTSWHFFGSSLYVLVLSGTCLNFLVLLVVLLYFLVCFMIFFGTFGSLGTSSCTLT